MTPPVHDSLAARHMHSPVFLAIENIAQSGLVASCRVFSNLKDLQCNYTHNYNKRQQKQT